MLGFQAHAENLEASEMLAASDSAISDSVSELTPFIQIDAKGVITLFNPRPDMGQGTLYSMPAILAEELCVSLNAVKIEQTRGLAKHGNQNAGGSSSVRGLWIPLRKAGAAAREMLTLAAADVWKCAPGDCFAEQGAIIHRPSGKKLGYGELAAKAAQMPVPKEPKLKDHTQFTILGKPAPRPDVPSKTDGSAVFGIDVKVPNMLYASVERCPTILGAVASFDDAAAKKVKGVKHVIKCERPAFGRVHEGVAVLATSYWAATQGRKALKITWNTKPEEIVNTDALFAQMRTHAKSSAGTDSEASKGDFDKTFASNAAQKGAKNLAADYETPFLAHAPLEPENVVAHYKVDAKLGDSVEIWAPTQGAPWTIRAVARAFSLKPENVIVNPTLLGGSFGRKGGLDDFIKEAVHISKSAQAPVKVVWTREDDISQSPLRPGAVNSLKASLDAAGRVVALQHKVIVPSIQAQPGLIAKSKVDDWAMEGFETKDSPYLIPTVSFRYVQAETPLPVMWWRSVYASTNMFGNESFWDELAHAAGQDPIAFRLAHLDKSTTLGKRFEAVLTMLREKSGWSQPLPQGKGRGVAIAHTFESICAHVITVGRDKENKLRAENVVTVLDCGSHVNTDTVKAQTEGNVVMGITAAIKDAITLQNGRVQQTNFDTYRMLRIHEMPTVDIHIMPSHEAPGGVGEPGLPPIAAALTNAVFAATGKRVRALPFNIDEV